MNNLDPRYPPDEDTPFDADEEEFEEDCCGPMEPPPSEPDDRELEDW